MIQLLSQREIEFLNDMKTLLSEYNVEVSYKDDIGIRLIVDGHIEANWEHPVVFKDAFDEIDIDQLLETMQATTLEVVDNYQHRPGKHK
ncbi:MAG: hypothetical protein RR711_11475 [Bacteroides sp.]